MTTVPPLTRHSTRPMAIILAQTATKRQQTSHQWASTPASRLKLVHSGAVVPRDLQAKQRRVARCPQEPSAIHAGVSVMMYTPLDLDTPTKLLSCWQDPWREIPTVLNTKKFRRLLRHRHQLLVLRTHPTGPSTIPTTVSPGLTVSVSPPFSQVKYTANPEDTVSALHQSEQVKDSIIREIIPSQNTHYSTKCM